MRNREIMNNNHTYDNENNDNNDNNNIIIIINNNDNNDNNNSNNNNINNINISNNLIAIRPKQIILRWKNFSYMLEMGILRIHSKNIWLS